MRTFYFVFLVILLIGCKEYQFTGKWQSLNDQSCLIEFTDSGKVIYYVDKKSFWGMVTEHGELNYEIKEFDDGWYTLNGFDGDELFHHGRIEIVNDSRIRIYYHKHNDILDLADEYHRVTNFDQFDEVMNELLKTN